jgi:hypothetical protein
MSAPSRSRSRTNIGRWWCSDRFGITDSRFLFLRTSGHGDEIYTSKSCSAAIEECDELVESGFFEVSVEKSRAKDCRQIEKHELCGDDDLADVQQVSDSSASANYLAVKPHQGAVQVSYLADSCTKEDLGGMVFIRSEIE